MNALLAGVSALFLYAASAPGMAPQEEYPFDRGGCGCTSRASMRNPLPRWNMR